jgi:hypothetical protein
MLIVASRIANPAEPLALGVGHFPITRLCGGAIALSCCAKICLLAVGRLFSLPPPQFFFALVVFGLAVIERPDFVRLVVKPLLAALMVFESRFRLAYQAGTL